MGRYDGWPADYAAKIEAGIEAAGWTIVSFTTHHVTQHYWVASRPGLYLTASAEHVEFVGRPGEGVTVAFHVEPEGHPPAADSCAPIARCFPGAPSKARWTGNWVPFDGVGSGVSYSVLLSPQPLIEAVDANIRAAGWTITRVGGDPAYPSWTATRPGFQLSASLVEYLDRVDFLIRPI